MVELNYSEDSMRRYRKVFHEFMEYSGDCDYSQSKGTDFLLWKFKQLGGFVTSGEHSKNEMYYFRVIRSLAEYFNFGTLFRRNDYYGEIVWPVPFKDVTESFLKYEIEYGCSRCHYTRCRDIIRDLILFLDSAGIHDLNDVTAELMSRFTQTMVGLAPVTIAERLSALRQGLYILHPNNVGRCGHICNASYAVSSDARGKHIGEQLIKDCLQKGKELGFRVLQFNAVVESNTHARHLYERLGFTQLGTIPGGFRMKDGHYENICPYYKEL